MPYIARTDGGSTVLELRKGTLDDLADADRGDWRSVAETRPAIDSFSQVHTVPAFAVSNDGTQVSMTWQIASLPEIWQRMRLKDYAANLRWRRQQSPYAFTDGPLAGAIVDATEASKTKIDQALSVLERGWAPTLDFKTSNGWLAVDLAALTLIAQALVAREQALFTAEKEVCAAIDAGTVTSTSAVDGWPWP